MRLDVRFSSNVLALYLATLANQRRHSRGSLAKPESQAQSSTSLEKKLQDEEKKYAGRISSGEINVNRLKIVVVGDGGCGKVSAKTCLHRPHDHLESSRPVCFMHFRQDASLKWVVVSL